MLQHRYTIKLLYVLIGSDVINLYIWCHLRPWYKTSAWRLYCITLLHHFTVLYVNVWMHVLAFCILWQYKLSAYFTLWLLTLLMGKCITYSGTVLAIMKAFNLKHSYSSSLLVSSVINSRPAILLLPIISIPKMSIIHPQQPCLGWRLLQDCSCSRIIIPKGDNAWQCMFEEYRLIVLSTIMLKESSELS